MKSPLILSSLHEWDKENELFNHSAKINAVISCHQSNIFFTDFEMFSREKFIKWGFISSFWD